MISHVCEFTGKPPEFVEMFLQDMEMELETQRLREREEALSNKLEQLSEEENVMRREEVSESNDISLCRGSIVSERSTPSFSSTC